MKAYNKKRTLEYREHMPLHKGSIADSIASYFKSRHEVLAVYLFGSYAQDRKERFSDIDLDVLLDHKTFAAKNDSGDR